MAYDLSGKRFGYYTVMHRVEKKGWLCVCDCGKEQEVRTTKLVKGESQSCGCMRGVLSNETKQKNESNPKRNLEDENERLRNALEFYAEPINWYTRLYNDVGNVARKALEGEEK